MNKKIVSLILILFGLSTIVATYLYFRTPSKREPIFSSPKEEITEPLRKGYTLVKDANLFSTKADTTVLVRFNKYLYAKALDQSSIEGNLNYEGVVDVIVENEYVPKIHGETNCADYQNAIVVRASEGDLVLQKQDQLTLFYIVSEY